MYVRRLQLTSFRNYANLDIELAAGRLLFAGGNAQGKSNLLEAVQLLASGKSARAGVDAEMIGWQSPAWEGPGEPFARLQATVERRAGHVDLETLIVGRTAAVERPSLNAGASAGRAGKRFRVNGVPRRGIDFVGQLRSVLFTADDLEIISGAPAGRRAFLDTALSQLDRTYYGSLQRYARVLQQRNATLRRIREGVAGPDELALWDETLAREGSVIITARQQTMSALSGLAAAAHRELSGDAAEDLAITYEPQLGDEWRRLLPEPAPTSAVQPLFAAALAGQRRRDIAAGVSLVGPHRDEVAIRLNGTSAASFGSRAQIRTAALSLRLAEARLLRGEADDPPVLLLDDIVSELDEGRRRSVLEGLAGFDQVWFTATNPAWLPPDFVSSCRLFEVREGAVTEA